MDDDTVERWKILMYVWDILEKTTRLEEQQPKEPSRLCWHCCHDIPHAILPYPISYSRTKFRCGGQFCSWECIKGYSREKGTLYGPRRVNIRHYRKMITGLTDPVVPAPPKIVLKAFGGHLTIEEFRKPARQVDYCIDYGQLIQTTSYTIHDYTSEEKHPKPADKPLHIRSTMENDSLKLRRPKPLVKEKNTLERVLGLNQFTNFIKTG
jgi:hypothetical protein